jgi:hypothetical protein
MTLDTCAVGCGMSAAEPQRAPHPEVATPIRGFVSELPERLR